MKAQRPAGEMSSVHPSRAGWALTAARTGNESLSEGWIIQPASSGQLARRRFRDSRPQARATDVPVRRIGNAREERRENFAALIIRRRAV